jgi:isoaspartyl peptidase/L-asparaginase-like protein (Ntn-hydrolase superfamily)
LREGEEETSYTTVMKAILFLHAGAGTFHSSKPKVALKEATDIAFQCFIDAIDAGIPEKEAGIKTIVAAIKYLENAQGTNAGTGSALGLNGRVECDAALMEGEGGFGAVGCTSRLKNPIQGAECVLMKEVGHLPGGLVAPMVLVGLGAELYSQEAGIPLVEPESLITEKSQRQHAKFMSRIPDETVYDTVGAVFMTPNGQFFSGVSTGGIPLKTPGRLSHVCMFGSGCFANNEQGVAVSSSGKGEQIMRIHLAQSLATAIAGKEMAHEVLHSTMTNLLASSDMQSHYQGHVGEAGAILLQRVGETVYPWVAQTTPGMAVAWKVQDAETQTRVFTKPLDSRVSIVGLPPIYNDEPAESVSPETVHIQDSQALNIPRMDVAVPPISNKAVLDYLKTRPLSKRPKTIDWSRVQSAASIGLHFHQPQILESGVPLHEAQIVSNVEDMRRQGHWDATKYLECYERLGKDICPRLTSQGFRPSVMVEYSGTLLWGLRQMGRADIVSEGVNRLANDAAFAQHVEILGCPWGHAVAPSTPAQDFKLHCKAWQIHFIAEFGTQALARVKGFSPSEMAIPNDPDVAYAFVETLLDCGYTWVLVQEHTIEQMDGRHVLDAAIPHRLVCKNSRGDEVEIVCIIKTQGSDTKLVGQMQPWYEAKTKQRAELGTFSIPRIVTQIADGENGGVIMNDFPPKFESVVSSEASGDAQHVLTTVSEYLDHISSLGLGLANFPPVQPKHQHLIWKKCSIVTPETVAKTIVELKETDHTFNMEGGSWTNDISWVKGYGNVLKPMESLSVRFHQLTDGKGLEDDERYREALYYLLMSQTSCYRYWGEGAFTEYAKELIRRGHLALDGLAPAPSVSPSVAPPRNF